MSKPNTIKRLLSYFFDFPIESRSSEINKTLSVVLSRGSYRLDAENATYSFENKYRSFLTAFEKTNLNDKKLEHVLILGLGLGSIPFMLENHFQTQCKSFTTVEIDQVVIDLAKKYLPKAIVDKTDFICEDAFVYKNPSNKKFDLIAFDVFIDDVTDEKFRSVNYLKTLKSQLSKNGVLYYNLMSDSANLEKTAIRFFNDVFLTVFPQATKIDTDGNFVLYGC